MTEPRLQGNPENYRWIAAILYTGFGASGIAIVILNMTPVELYLLQVFEPTKLFVLQLYFWATMGATIASYKFFATDKDMNECESQKPNPDPSLLRYPDSFDVILYSQRIVFSGFLGVVGAAILYAGLGYFDAPLETGSLKQNVFFIVFCFLIGVYQNDFLAFLAGLKQRLFRGVTEQSQLPPRSEKPE